MQKSHKLANCGNAQYKERVGHIKGDQRDYMGKSLLSLTYSGAGRSRLAIATTKSANIERVGGCPQTRMSEEENNVYVDAGRLHVDNGTRRILRLTANHRAGFSTISHFQASKLVSRWLWVQLWCITLAMNTVLHVEALTVHAARKDTCTPGH